MLFQRTREPVEERRDAPYSRYDKQWCDLFSANEEFQRRKGWRERQPFEYNKLQHPLEVDFRYDLTCTGSTAGAGGNTEPGQIDDVGPVGGPAGSEVCAIENVGEFCAKLEIDGFRNPSALDEPHVVTIDVRIAQLVEIYRCCSEAEIPRN